MDNADAVQVFEGKSNVHEAPQNLEQASLSLELELLAEPGALAEQGASVSFLHHNEGLFLEVAPPLAFRHDS